MTTLIIGFVGLVIIPAFIIAEVLNRVIKEPADKADKPKNDSFTLSCQRRRSGK